MDNTMIFIILFGGIAVVLFLLASGLSTPPTHAATEKPNKVVIYIYITAIVFMIIAIVILWASPFTVGDLVESIKEF